VHGAFKPDSLHTVSDQEQSCPYIHWRRNLTTVIVLCFIYRQSTYDFLSFCQLNILTPFSRH